MPNLSPAPDTAEHLRAQLSLIKRDARVRIYPYGTITRGEAGTQLSDMEALAPRVIAFSDDGRGVQSDAMMERAMKRAKSLGKMIVAHCEDNSLLRGGYIHSGAYARAHGHAGICSESEYRQLARDLALVQKTGCAYHACHISAKESVALIRDAKKSGLDVSCETAPHYLVLTEADLQEHGRFKMNPPLREEADRLALLEGIADGTIDMIATDHAPHSAAEKAKGLAGSAMGVVGLECAFAVLYTHLVKSGILSMERLLTLMSAAPKKRFGISTGKDFAVFETAQPYCIDPAEFASKGRATPFEGMQVYGRCILTVANGKIVYREGKK